MPGPFLELKSQPVQLFIEEPLRIDVGCDEPALVRAVVHRRESGRVQNSSRGGAGRQPREIVGIENEQAVTADLLEQSRDTTMFMVEIGPAIGCLLTGEFGFLSG